MTDPALLLEILVFCIAWVGHACLWVSLLSHLYGQPLPKQMLKVWRLFTGLIILGLPLLYPVRDHVVTQLYLWACVAVGGIVFPAVTIARMVRKPPACLVAESTRSIDLWPELGQKLIGDGHLAALARLPGNGLFRVDVTELTLALPNLPPAWDGLTLVVAGDFHFHGTPARPFFDRIIDELLAVPPPDLVCLVGDYLDSDEHHGWIGPVLGRLQATGAKLAILGNHDRYHDPQQVRLQLAAAGYTVLGSDWFEVTLRGVPCAVVGHEGPWFAPPIAKPLTASPPFRLCLSHTPDNFYWAIANHIDLMFCGHVHGGGIRVPVVGSIFVPSVYGRRFDQGVFEKGRTVMAVTRGLSGREPIRFRCNPQVLRITLRPRVLLRPV